MKYRWTHKTWMRWESQRYFSRSYLSAICFLRALKVIIFHTCCLTNSPGLEVRSFLRILASQVARRFLLTLAFSRSIALLKLEGGNSFDPSLYSNDLNSQIQHRSYPWQEHFENFDFFSLCYASLFEMFTSVPKVTWPDVISETLFRIGWQDEKCVYRKVSVGLKWVCESRRAEARSFEYLSVEKNKTIGWHFASTFELRVERVSRKNENFLHWNVPQRNYVINESLPDRGFQWASR